MASQHSQEDPPAAQPIQEVGEMVSPPRQSTAPSSSTPQEPTLANIQQHLQRQQLVMEQLRAQMRRNAPLVTGSSATQSGQQPISEQDKKEIKDAMKVSFCTCL